MAGETDLLEVEPTHRSRSGQKDRFREVAMQWRALRAFLAKESVSIGVDVGISHVKISSVIRQRGRPTLADGCATLFPPHLRSNSAERRFFLRETLRDYVARSRVPFLAQAAFCLSGPEVMVNTLRVPQGPPRELREAIRTELERSLPYPLEQAAWSYSLGPEAPVLEGGQVAVLAIAAPASWIQELVTLCRSLGLVPTLITATPLAVHRLLLENVQPAGQQSVAILKIGSSSSVLTLAHKGFPEFLRLIPVGVDHLVRGLIRTVTAPQGQHAITASEAEDLIRKYGINMEESLALPIAGLSSAQVYAMLRPTLEALYLEIQRTLHYYRQAFGRTGVERLWVVGGGACIPHLTEFLNANMDEATVEPLDPLSALQEWGQPPPAVQEMIKTSGPQFVSSIGMAAPEPQEKGAAAAIGSRTTALRPAAAALPVFHRYNYRLEWIQLMGRWVASVGLIVTLVLSGIVRLQMGRYQRFVRDAKVQVGQLEPKVRQIEEYNRLKKVIAERDTLIDKAISRQPLWAGVAKELSRIIPEGIRLTSLETVEGTLPKQIRMAGEILPTYTTVEVLYAQVQLALEESPFFTDIELLGIQRDLHSPVSRATFELTCRLVY